AVHDIPGAPAGAYWDGGITDYHLHLNYLTPRDRVVLYPHFQRAVVPGWLDKSLKWRHHATDFLRNAVVLAPNPDWVKTLPNGKLPDRHDFNHYAHDYDARVRVWQQAADASQQLADEFAQWLRNPDPRLVKPL
ncbi:MAG: phospholipase, partial [Burkholderiaceae bacterium]|nr:phospholipase [Burkholderiaceae bacterium]